MNFLRKSSCLLRRYRIFHVNSCQFICNLSKTTVGRPRPSKGHFGNRLGLLLLTKPGTRPRFQPRSRCISSSNPGLDIKSPSVGLGQVDPQNCDRSERNSSVTSRRQEEIKKEDCCEIFNKYIKELKWNLDSRHPLNKAHITRMVDMMSQEKCSDRQAVLDLGLLLLRSCGHCMSSEFPTERVKLAHHIVSTLKQLDLPMTVELHNELLTCYIDNGYPTEPSEFLEKMSAVPNEETYQLLLWCAGDIERAFDLIQRMKDKGIPVSEPVFNALVYIHARTGDSASAQGVFETMQSAQLSPSSHTFTALLRGLAECGDVRQMQKTFREATAAGAALSQNQVLSVVRTLAATGHSASIPEVLPWLPEQLDADGTSTLKNMLRYFVRLGLDDAVTMLISKLPVEESTPFGLFVLQEMVKAHRPVKAILSAVNLVSERNPLALSQATFTALRTASTDLALALFEAMKEAGAPIRAHYYWPLLRVAKEKGEQEVFRMVEHARRMDVPLDATTFTSYFLNFISLEAPTPLLRRLQDLGFTVTQVFSPLVRTLISNGQLDAAYQLCGAHPIQPDCEQMIAPLATALLSGSRLDTVVDLLKVLARSCKEPDDWVGRFLLELLTNQRVAIDNGRAEVIIKALKDAGLSCSPHAVEVISRQISGQQSSGERPWFVALTGLVNDKQTPLPVDKMEYYMRHPRNMNLEELRCHLGELQAKKMNTRGVLRLLLMMYCKLCMVKDVDETKEELERAGHNFSRGMKAALFNFYVKTSQLDKAKPIYDELNEKSDFILDDYKAVDFATLLVTHNKTEDAVFVLDTASKRGIKGGPSIERNCQNLLVATSLEGQPEDTRMILDTLVELGYCKISNKMLGPLIRTYLLRDDVERAVKEFHSCVTKYNVTPIIYELLCHLGRKASDETHGGTVSAPRAKELIQQVIALSGQVHNPKNIMGTFVIALAEIGNIKWLEQTFKESAKEIDYNTLVKHCERLVDKNKPHAIKNLIEGLRREATFNLAPLYSFLLQIHCRHGDTQGALDLWTRMQETDCRPTSHFMTTFKRLLESHKVPFPGAAVVPT